MMPLRSLPFSFCLRLLGCALLGSLLLFAVPAGGEDLKDSQKDLEKIRQRIKRIADGLEKKQVEEKNLKKNMTSLEGEMKRLQARETTRKTSLSGLGKEIGGQEKLIVEIREKSRQRREMVEKRLSVMYRGGQRHLLRLLFSGNSPAAIAEEYHLLKRVVHYDRELLEQYRRDQSELNDKLAQLTALRQQEQTELQDLEGSRKTLEEGRRVKKRLLARLRSQQAEMSGELTQLKEKAARLQSLVKKLERVKPPEYTEKTGVFAQQKGHLPWPVKGRIKVGFGTCRLPSLGTLYECQGIEIESSRNLPILASWNGTVIFANLFKGYGNLIIIDHGDNFYTLYAQASRLLKTVGEKVKAGEPIAYPGFENADSVYFEIRHRGTPQDPLAWLKP
jgi:septal ring factor EnvC (AmiA/AmiB activator)